MTSLTEREKAFEAKYEHDQEIAFKVHVRQIKLFGLWAAGRMGLSKDEASAYAKKLIDSDIEKRGGDALQSSSRTSPRRASRSASGNWARNWSGCWRSPRPK